MGRDNDRSPRERQAAVGGVMVFDVWLGARFQYGAAWDCLMR